MEEVWVYAAWGVRLLWELTVVKKHSWVFMRKLGQEAHLSFHEEVWVCNSSKFSCRRWGSWGKKHIWVFMRKFGFATHLSFHVVGEEVGARSTAEFSWGSWDKKHSWVFMMKLGQEAHLSVHEEAAARSTSEFPWGSWGKKHIWVSMRKFGLATHLSFHEEVMSSMLLKVEASSRIHVVVFVVVNAVLGFKLNSCWASYRNSRQEQQTGTASTTPSVFLL
jgi:hypothetical protein